MNQKIDTLIKYHYTHHKNYRIEDHPNTGNDLCYIYCSSNGLYKKGDADDFQKRIIENDRYEWSSVRANVTPAREIFIRDIWLSWYVCGINSELNSYEAVLYFLRDITRGYTVRCVGVSSGGFMANIIAMSLDAELSYSFSCQYSLRNHFDHLQKNPLLKDHLELHGDYFFEYYPRLKNSKTKVIYVYPDESEQDQIQAALTESFSNVLPIAIHKERHGVCLSPYSLPGFLSLDFDKCKKLKNIHSRDMMILRICDPMTVINLVLNKLIRRVQHRRD